MRLISSCLFYCKGKRKEWRIWRFLKLLPFCNISIDQIFFFLTSILSYRHRTEEAQRCFQENLWPLLLYDPAVLHQGSSGWWSPSQSCWGELWIAVFLGSQMQWMMGSWMLLTQMFMELIELLPIFFMQHHNAPSLPENDFPDLDHGWLGMCWAETCSQPCSYLVDDLEVNLNIQMEIWPIKRLGICNRSIITDFIYSRDALAVGFSEIPLPIF